MNMNFETYSNYVYLLEAARASAGLALGWRGFIEQYIEDGTLVPATHCWNQFPSSLYALLSNNGTTREPARRCLKFMSLELVN